MIALSNLTASQKNSKKRSCHRISDEMRCLTDDCVMRVYLSRMQPSITATYWVLVHKVDEANAQRPLHARERAPSIAYLRRRINSLDRDEVNRARMGSTSAKRRLRPQYPNDES